MLNNAQLDLAVSRGIISREQVQALVELASADDAQNAAGLDFSVSADDEPFRLLKGFRDFFIAIGIVILSIGLSMLLDWPVDFITNLDARVDSGDHSAWFATFSVAVFIGVALLISEWVTKSQRLPLSSLVLTIVFAIWSAMFFASLVFAIGLSFGINQQESENLQLVVTYAAIFGALAALILYYLRYRLPFVLLPLAAAAVTGFVVIADGGLDFDNNSHWARVVVGLGGVAVFCLAMWYDLKDRYRTTRLSECAFWLHLLAAPMIVHSVLYNGLEGEFSSITILLVVMVLAVFALIIDRRAMLVSALFYLGYSIFTIVKSFSNFGQFNDSIAFVILGIFVLGLGLGWASIRRFFVNQLVWKSLRDKLPPVIA